MEELEYDENGEIENAGGPEYAESTLIPCFARDWVALKRSPYSYS
jgi:hypothetical protein